MYAIPTLVTVDLDTPTNHKRIEVLFPVHEDDFNPRLIFDETEGLIRTSFTPEELGDKLKAFLSVTDKEEETLKPTYFSQVSFQVGKRRLVMFNALMTVHNRLNGVSFIEFSAEEYAWMLTTTRMKQVKQT